MNNSSLIVSFISDNVDVLKLLQSLRVVVFIFDSIVGSGYTYLVVTKTSKSLHEYSWVRIVIVMFLRAWLIWSVVELYDMVVPL